MKTLITITIALLSTTLLVAQTVPNGGFENWTDDEPDEWTTSNVGPITTISQSVVSHSGSYAVKGQTDPEETIVPQIETGYDNLGFPVSVAYDQLSFWYQYVEQGSDMMLVNVTIADEDYNTLGYGSLEIEDATGGYTLAVLPIEYDNMGTPAFAIVSFGLYDATGGDPPDKETYFLIDDVELSGGVGIDENASTKINIYPNPASGSFKITLPEHSTYDEIRVVNNIGQLVFSQQIHETEKDITINPIQNWPKGIYFIHLSGEGLNTTKKIIFE